MTSTVLIINVKSGEYAAHFLGDEIWSCDPESLHWKYYYDHNLMVQRNASPLSTWQSLKREVEALARFLLLITRSERVEIMYVYPVKSPLIEHAAHNSIVPADTASICLMVTRNQIGSM